MMNNMQEYKVLFLLLPLALILSCGDSSDRGGVELGSQYSLHPGIESLLDKGIEDNPAALTLSEADSIKQAVTRLKKSASDVRAIAKINEADLLSQFDMYPHHGISSRVLGVSYLTDRDSCLERCSENRRCGAVTHVRTIDSCFFHGPTQSKDKILPTTLTDTTGVYVIDTFVFRARNQVYEEAMTFSWGFNVTQGTGASPRMKLLFDDGTASVWKDLGPMLVPEDSYYVSLSGLISAPSKNIEGMILSTSSSDGVQFISSGSYVCRGGDCANNGSLPPRFVWDFRSSARSSITLDTDCDSDVSDGCAPKLALSPNPDTSEEVFVNTPIFTLDDIKQAGAAFLW